ncbi:MAG: class F sortase [Marmoricola sp.]
MSSHTSTGRRAALVGLIVATVIALVWTLWPDAGTHTEGSEIPPPQVVVPGTKLVSAECNRQATSAFVPTRITIAKVARNAPVLALGRDDNNVPQAPAISTLGKTQFAWDDPKKDAGHVDKIKPPGAAPGSTRGHVLMNAHTWPDGTALGNRLLEHLQVGGRIVLRGRHAELCYRVTKRFVIKAVDGSAEYYRQSGPEQIALIVCSPPRLGPGNWAHRTIWFASPITAEDPA